MSLKSVLDSENESTENESKISEMNADGCDDLVANYIPKASSSSSSLVYKQQYNYPKSETNIQCRSG